MHPSIQEALVRDRIATMVGARTNSRRAQRIRSKPQARQRIGWFLVTVGLHVASERAIAVRSLG